jgi:hypothetical protein
MSHHGLGVGDSLTELARGETDAAKLLIHWTPIGMR